MNNHNKRLSIVIESEQRFFRNVRYLAKKRDLTFIAVSKMASDDKFTCDYRAISLYGGWSRRKPERRLSLYYLSAYCAALGVELGQMLSTDMEREEEGLK